MHSLGLTHDKPHKKSARIVGEVLGRYHPHGDAPIYEALTRLAQPFSLRYPLVDGQGNFGSLDDPPAASRYTEARLSEIASLLLSDIEKDTVEMRPNFDSSLLEPSFLPARFPNLLINGCSGIAVGMSTSIPPHNLGEICDALIFLIDKELEFGARAREVTVDELLRHILGPDFPTGGVVIRYDEKGEDTLKSAYTLGKGKIRVMARFHIEQAPRGRKRIVVTELPYQVQKSSLIERIASLVRDGRLEGVHDIRDESDRSGLRLCIELSRRASPPLVLNELLRLTPLSTTFSFIMLALVRGEPQLLSLKRALKLYLEHRIEVLKRRTRYELAKAKERAHLLEGLLLALENLDSVIEIIKRSRRQDTALKNLVRSLKLERKQAQAVLDFPLKRLVALERKKIELELERKKREIRSLESLLKSKRRILSALRKELTEIKKKYGDPRRTRIVEREVEELTERDLLPEEEVLIAITRNGQIFRLPAEEEAKIALRLRGETPLSLIFTTTRDDLYLFTNEGKATSLPVHLIPEEGRINAFVPIRRSERVITVLSLTQEEKDGYLFLATRKGKVKRVKSADFLAKGMEGVTVMEVGEGDELGWAKATSGEKEIILITKLGKAIRFSEKEVRPMGLQASGVVGVKLGKGDEVVAMELAKARASLLVATSTGYVKRTSLSSYPSQRRYGSGVITANLSKRTGHVVGACVVHSDDKVMLVSEKGAIKIMKAKSAPSMGRSTQGKKLVKLKGKDALTACIPLRR
jgi:DNA gyrase subunit A